MLEWTDAYATGVAELDEQHRALFDILNELQEANALGPAAAEQAFPATVAKLRAYATAHFTAEELCMIANRCEVRAENAQAHQEFLAALGAAEERIAQEGPTAAHAREAHRLLRDWVNEHLIGVDARLRGCIARAREAGRALGPPD